MRLQTASVAQGPYLPEWAGGHRWRWDGAELARILASRSIQPWEWWVAPGQWWRETQERQPGSQWGGRGRWTGYIVSPHQSCTEGRVLWWSPCPSHMWLNSPSPLGTP